MDEIEHFQKLYGADSKECVKIINNNKHLFKDDLIEEIYQNRHPECENRTSLSTKQPIGSYPEKSLHFYTEENGEVYCFLPSELKNLNINPYTGNKLNKKDLKLYFEDEIIHPVVPFHKIIKNLYCPRFKKEDLENDEVFILLREENDLKEFLENSNNIDGKMIGEQGSFKERIVEVLPGYKLYIVKLKNKNVSEVHKDNIKKNRLIYENKIPKFESKLIKKDWKLIHDFIKKVKEGYTLNDKLEFVKSISDEEIKKVSSLNLKSNREITVYYPINEKSKGMKEGDEFILRPDGNIRKWYMDYCTASKYGYGGIVLQAKIKPGDVILSLEYLPKEYQSVFSVNPQRLVLTQPEKVFQTKIVNIHGGFKGDHFAQY